MTETDDQDEFVRDAVTGRGEKSVLAALNKSKIGKHEMDEIFNTWG